MLIDCDTCLMDRTTACDDCVVSLFLTDGPLELSNEEHQAIDQLATAGLVPPLRLVSDTYPRASSG